MRKQVHIAGIPKKKPGDKTLATVTASVQVK